MMGKAVAVIQSSYIPWKGYFDIINMCDEFVLMDDVQFTRRDWRNRNIIKTAHGIKWLTIPVESKGRYLQRIDETKVAGQGWRKEHWNSIKHFYSRAPYFGAFREVFEELYLNSGEEYLSRINYQFITAINNILGITTRIRWSSEFEVGEDKNDRIINIGKHLNAKEYISGPSAKNYIDETAFEKAGIILTWMDYSGYPEYIQRYLPFEHRVSILDLIFNTGTEASLYMKSFQSNA